MPKLRSESMYFTAKFISRLLCASTPYLPSKLVSFMWGYISKNILASSTSSGVQSVYGVWLTSRPEDSTFKMAVTGSWGFYLSDLLVNKKENFAFLDIGANCGVYSLLAAKNKQCTKIDAIEPNPIVFADLVSNAKLNQLEFSMHNLAIGAKEGFASLSFKQGNSGRGSLVQTLDSKVDVIMHDVRYISKLYENTEERVFVKVDVEGYEPEIIRQLSKSPVTQRIDDLFIEISPDWITKDDLDYVLKQIESWGLAQVWCSSKVGQYDAHFRRVR